MGHPQSKILWPAENDVQEQFKPHDPVDELRAQMALLAMEVRELAAAVRPLAALAAVLLAKEGK